MINIGEEVLIVHWEYPAMNPSDFSTAFGRVTALSGNMVQIERDSYIPFLNRKVRKWYHIDGRKTRIQKITK